MYLGWCFPHGHLYPFPASAGTLKWGCSYLSFQPEFLPQMKGLIFPSATSSHLWFPPESRRPRGPQLTLPGTEGWVVPQASELLAKALLICMQLQLLSPVQSFGAVLFKSKERNISEGNRDPTGASSHWAHPANPFIGEKKINGEWRKKKRGVSVLLCPLGFGGRPLRTTSCSSLHFPNISPSWSLFLLVCFFSPPSSLFSVSSLNLMEYFAECLLFNQVGNCNPYRQKKIKCTRSACIRCISWEFL